MKDEPEEAVGGKSGTKVPGWRGKREEREGREKREAEFSRRIKVKAARKLRARRAGDENTEMVWAGLGMIGLVGWGISVPTILGVVLGIWLDRRFPAEHSWTLTLLFAGLLVGCMNAWRWIAREERLTRRKESQEALGKKEAAGQEMETNDATTEMGKQDGGNNGEQKNDGK
jgi:ATP synthase protein I